ncbi:hypothetical protein JTE90_028850 [Oedothorax gibbosus]|uniref:C2H2-type domain-containing protein n=1 Tax=Oedothorax gibbosus TaxID=931172 RepID=A0AAV6VZT0_9ARAC|nr:hypothetical protein JTE90_028850 [Oedothorax gibbosus]
MASVTVTQRGAYDYILGMSIELMYMTCDVLVGLPLQFPSAFTTVHAPIPVDHRTHEGRYVWDPRLHGAMSHPTGRIGVEAPGHLPDFSHFSAARRDLQGSPMELGTPYRLSPYVESVLTSLHGTPTMGSPIMQDARVPLPMDYLQQVSMLHQRNLLDARSSLHASTRAMSDLYLAMEGSRNSSPGVSSKAPSRHGRKRPLSSSPYPDIDINAMIRFSPFELVHMMNAPRSSSGGSYGHLSAGSLSPSLSVSAPTPLPHFHQLHLMRQGLMSPFLLPPSSSMGQQAMFPGHVPTPTQTKDAVITSNSVPVATTSAHSVGKQIPKETQATEGTNEEDRDGTGEPKDEPDFIETNCHWTDCGREFLTQDDLVKHIVQDHLPSAKKNFVCRWKDCTRGEKPFKAQYMLVVHMRRHTGEKPHTCSFEGCPKAYSRLENLKTHLRSHTGEKPYLCEYPGCPKAFSNASDRAKHQNRTHSNAKPYVCRAEGCTKRYTDPSSLRKHVKTVHGAEFYAKKKHKGENPDANAGRSSMSPRDTNQTENAQATTDIFASPSAESSPSMLLESKDEAHTGTVNGMQNGIKSRNTYIVEEVPNSDNCVASTSGIDLAADIQNWELNESIDVEADEYLAAALCAVSATGNNASGPSGQGKSKKGGFHKVLKSKTSWLPKFQLPKGLFSRSSCSKAPNPSPENSSVQTRTLDGKKYMNLSPIRTPGCDANDEAKNKSEGSRRRQNSESSSSTCYGSMSSDVSSPSQDATKLNPSSYTPPSTQSSSDPISLWGSSRSSDVSSAEQLSPSKAVQKKPTKDDKKFTILRKTLPMPIASTSKETAMPMPIANTSKGTANSSPLNIQHDPPPYFQHTFQDQTNVDSEYPESCATNDIATDAEDLLTLASEAEYFQPRAGCSNQNTDWNQNSESEEDTDSVSTECNEELLSEDVVNYIVSREVSAEELENFPQNQNTLPAIVKSDHTEDSRGDIQETTRSPKSFCNQSNTNAPSNIFQNCDIQNQENSNTEHQSSSDINRINCNDDQSNVHPNACEFIPNNRFKTEYSPQSCNKGSPQSYSHRSPQSYNHRSPQSYNQRSSQSYNQSSPHSYNQSSPHSYNQSSPQPYNQTSPQSYNQTSPQSYNQRSPQSYNQSSPYSYNQSSPQSYNQTSPQSYNHGSPQSCNQETIQFNSCNKQTWSAQNLQQSESYPKKFSSTRGANSVQFQRNQMHYNNPPSYQAAMQCNVNNPQVQSQLIDNQSQPANCETLQNVEVSPVYYDQQPIQEFSNMKTVNQLPVQQISSQQAAYQFPNKLPISNQQLSNQLPMHQFPNQQSANQLPVKQFPNQQSANQLPVKQFPNQQSANQLPVKQFPNQQSANQPSVNQLPYQLSSNQYSNNQSSNQLPVNQFSNQQPINQFPNMQLANCQSINNYSNQHNSNELSSQQPCNNLQVNPYSNQQSTNHLPVNQFSNLQLANEQTNQFSKQQLQTYLPINQISKQSTIIQFPNQSSVNQYCSKNISNQLPANQISHHQVSNQFFNALASNQFSNHVPENQCSNQEAFNQFSNQPVMNQFSNQQVTNQFPNQQATNQFPDQQVTNQFPNQQATNQFPNQQATNQFPDQQAMFPYSNQQSMNQYSNQQTMNQYSNKQAMNQFSNQRPSTQSPHNQFSNQQLSNQFFNQPASNQTLHPFCNQQAPNVQQGQQFSNTKCLTQMSADVSTNGHQQSNPITPNYNGLYQQPQNKNCCENCVGHQNFSNFNRNTKQQCVSSQMILSGGTVQCGSQQEVSSRVVNNSSEVTIPKKEKSKFEKPTFLSSNMEPKTVSCSQNVSVVPTKINVPTHSQSNGIQDSSSQTVSNEPNATRLSAVERFSTSNMVINDMSSLLTSFVEETQHLGLPK